MEKLHRQERAVRLWEMASRHKLQGEQSIEGRVGNVLNPSSCNNSEREDFRGE